jgi:hypothetical protein
LKFYHWGAQKSTGDEFSGVDMRGEVIVLSRNIKIIGQDFEDWGGHIITSDTVELSSKYKLIYRTGSLYLDWVEL